MLSLLNDINENNLIGLLEDSIRDLEHNLPDLGLPELPSTPDLERELSELLEISFDLSCP